MDNYEDWTDDQINIEVGRHHNIYHTTHAAIAACSVAGDYYVNREYDPCNSPSDAWPIITENNILVSGKGWALVDDLLSDPYETHDKNPLRCAMIVFLKMSESDD